MFDSLQPHVLQCANLLCLNYLLEFAQTLFIESAMLSNSIHPLPPPSPFAFNCSQYQVCTEMSCYIMWPKYLSFSFISGPSNENWAIEPSSLASPELADGLLTILPPGKYLYASMVGLMANSKRIHTKGHLPTLLLSCPHPHNEHLLTHAFAAYPPTLTGKSGSVSCGVIAPFSWALMATKFCLCPSRMKSLFLLVLQDSYNQSQLAFMVRVPGVL